MSSIRSICYRVTVETEIDDTLIHKLMFVFAAGGKGPENIYTISYTCDET